MFHIDFIVPSVYIIARAAEKNPPPQVKKGQILMLWTKDDLITAFQSLTEENQDKVIRLAEAMLAEQEASANPIDTPHHNTVQYKG